MQQFKAVLGFEFGAYAKSKVYRIFTVVMVLIAFLLSLAPAILSNLNLGQKSDKPPVAIHDLEYVLTDESLNKHIGYGQWVRVDTDKYENIEEILEAKKYSHILFVENFNYTVILLGSKVMTFQTNTYNELIRENHLSMKFLESGHTQAEVDTILSNMPDVDLSIVGRDITQSVIIGYVLVMVLYMATLLYCNFVVTSVVREKSTKTIEMLVVSVKSTHLMFGKVIGVALAGFLQLALILLSTVIGIKLFGHNLTEINPIFEMLNFSDIAPILVYALIFFLLGFFSLAFITAALGSTVDRIEDATSASMFSTLIFVVSLIIAMQSIANPNSSFTVTASLMPLISPIIMFMRICLTEVSIIQILLSIIINIVTIILLGILSAKIYRAGVLMYGNKPSIKNILRSIKNA